MHYEGRAYRPPDLSLVEPNVPQIVAAIEAIERVGVRLLPSCSAVERAEVEALVFAAHTATSRIDPDGRDATDTATDRLPGPERCARVWLQYIGLMMRRALRPAQENLEDDTTFWRARLQDVRHAAAQDANGAADLGRAADRGAIDRVALRAAAETLPAATLPAATPSAVSILDDKGMFTVADLAVRFGVEAEPLRKRLDRWRKNHAASDGWIENTEATSRAARYTYQLGAVRHLIKPMPASGKASGERPTKKNTNGQPR